MSLRAVLSGAVVLRGAVEGWRSNLTFKESRLCLGTLNFGSRKMDQLTERLRAVEIKFTEEQLKQLDEIWPGPKGESPEAFAW